jgi:hypothetical protein
MPSGFVFWFYPGNNQRRNRDIVAEQWIRSAIITSTRRRLRETSWASIKKGYSRLDYLQIFNPWGRFL